MTSNNLKDNFELAEIEIYTPLQRNDLIEVFVISPDSPAYIEIDKKEAYPGDGEEYVFYWLKDAETANAIVGGGMIQQNYLSDPFFNTEDLSDLVQNLLGKEIKSVLWSDEGVYKREEFIHYFKPLVDYLKLKSIDFCVVGYDEECTPFIIGCHVLGKTTINPEFTYSYKEILE